MLRPPRPVLLLALLANSAPAWAGLKTDIEFTRAAGVPLTLDASTPDGAGPFPTVILVHGGGFTKGDKTTYIKPLFPVFTQANFTWFTINYRLAPQHPFPAAVEDVESALAWVKKNAKQYKVDPQRIALVGESAGAYLVDYVAAIDKPATRVAAVVSFYGPTGFVTRYQHGGTLTEGAQQFFSVKPDGSPALLTRLREISPILYVHHAMPPFLFIHGTEDEQVAYEQSPLMCDRMKQVGATCEVYTVSGARHGITGWENHPAWQGYKQKMIEWLRSVFAGVK